MDLECPPFKAFTVGGTNGKGSVSVYLSALFAAAGRGPIGTYTSPHVSDYRERIVVDGAKVEPSALVAAFEAVESARDTVDLSYFEFGTCAAFEVFRRAGVTHAVLEVGLGGRLDAVNAIEPEGAVVVSVGLDHQRWLGPDRDSIGREKGGIFRPVRPAIVGDRNPPAGLLKAAAETGAEPWLIGRDFDVSAERGDWWYRGRALERGPLPDPGIPGCWQRDNAAVALALFEATAPRELPEAGTIGVALAGAHLTARLERRFADGVEWLLDVAHNPDAAATLGTWLAGAEPRRTLAVFAMLGDKDAAAVAQALTPLVGRWFLGGLPGRRGLDAGDLAARCRGAIADPVLCENIASAVAAAVCEARPGDRIVVFGSFQTIEEALASGRVPARTVQCVSD